MIHFVNENDDLRHRRFVMPDGIRHHLEKILRGYDGDRTVDGYKRLQTLVNSNSLSFAEMKRLKNYFDHYSGSPENTEFILNGGEAMGNWVNNTLNTARTSVRDYKYALKASGVKNAFRKPHEVNRQNKKKNKPTVAKVQTSDASKAVSDNDVVKFEGKKPRTVILSEEQVDELIDGLKK